MEIKSKTDYHEAQRELEALVEAQEYLENIGVGKAVNARIELLTNAINRTN